jgi:hypothetical protein
MAPERRMCSRDLNIPSRFPHDAFAIHKKNGTKILKSQTGREREDKQFCLALLQILERRKVAGLSEKKHYWSPDTLSTGTAKSQCNGRKDEQEIIQTSQNEISLFSPLILLKLLRFGRS